MTQKLLSNPETEKIYKQRKIDVEPVFGYLKAILVSLVYHYEEITK